MRFAHHGVTVQYIDDSINFYVGAFGCTLLRRVSRQDGFVAVIVGVRGAHLHFAHLTFPDGTHLELIQYESPTPLESNVTGQPWRVGSAHMCLGVDDIEKTLQLVEEYGGILWSLDTATIPDGPQKGARVVYTRGPSGELIELFEAAR